MRAKKRRAKCEILGAGAGGPGGASVELREWVAWCQCLRCLTGIIRNKPSKFLLGAMQSKLVTDIEIEIGRSLAGAGAIALGDPVRVEIRLNKFGI